MNGSVTTFVAPFWNGRTAVAPVSRRGHWGHCRETQRAERKRSPRAARSPVLRGGKLPHPFLAPPRSGFEATRHAGHLPAAVDHKTVGPNIHPPIGQLPQPLGVQGPQPVGRSGVWVEAPQAEPHEWPGRFWPGHTPSVRRIRPEAAVIYGVWVDGLRRTSGLAERLRDHLGQGDKGALLEFRNGPGEFVVGGRLRLGNYSRSMNAVHHLGPLEGSAGGLCGAPAWIRRRCWRAIRGILCRHR